MYVAPALWVGLAVLAVVRLLNAIWLVIVGELLLEIWNGDKDEEALLTLVK